jgi:O-acetyl-ADP-ribose deacetylase (regulator of RNase III)
MPIVIRSGNIFDSGCEALVNTVNCRGVMGAGLAKAFSRKYPQIMGPYKHACMSGVLVPGKVQILEVSDLFESGPRYVVNFPTKDDWRNPSRLEWVDDGLTCLVAALHERHIRSVAIPPLGCGLGGLSWSEVEPLIRDHFSRADDITVEIYAPR